MDLSESKVYSRKSFKGIRNEKNSGRNSHGKPLAGETDPSLDLASDDSSSQVVVMGSLGSGKGMGKFGFSRQENQVVIHLSSRSKKEMMEIRRNLEGELDMVRKLVRKIEGKGGPISQGELGDGGGGARGVQLEVASGGVRESRPLNQLSISVLENSQGGNADKEKRTPKANPLYRKSDFLLAKDRFSSSESNKKSKSNGKKQGGEVGMFPIQVLKSCSGLLERMMKHKHGWVFNKPVDAKNLGLHDYFDIIKHPMDLGTVKSNLDKNLYKSPREFTDDVRLTFQNAMTYNPKGQDVYVMAEQLLKMFEDKWMLIEADYMRKMRLSVENEVSLPMPKSKKAPQRVLPEMSRLLDQSESTSHSVDPTPKQTNVPHTGRTPAPKKPKARDPNKREMTYDEKQKLSTDLQSLPSEKLDNVVQIIKKRNPSLSQHDDEIEVDIDTFDTETLWELDRFVTNYKKSLSKNKRKAEVGDQEAPEIQEDVQDKNPAPVVVEPPIEAEKELVPSADGKKTSSLSPDQAEKQGAQSDRSSSSNSHSGSSSSDAGSDSSSGNGSDDVHSPRT